MNINRVSLARATELFSYDPDSGVLAWKRRPTPSCTTVQIGKQVGTLSPGKCIETQIDGVRTKIHHLAWLMYCGIHPDREIDHINGDPTDNRISNLRLATRLQNMANTKKPCTNTSGVKGVSWDKSRRCWKAAVQVKGRTIHLGRYSDIHEAGAVYERAAKEHFGEFARLE